MVLLVEALSKVSLSITTIGAGIWTEPDQTGSWIRLVWQKLVNLGPKMLRLTGSVHFPDLDGPKVQMFTLILDKLFAFWTLSSCSRYVFSSSVDVLVVLNTNITHTKGLNSNN